MGYNKETNMWVGYIYCIENKVNGKKYIGQTIMSIEQRWNGHKYESSKEKLRGAIAGAIKKYGEENFDMYELVHVESKNKEDIIDKLNELEVFFIELHDTLVTNNHGYNIQAGGNSSKKYEPICSYDMDGNFLKEFFCPQDVSDYYNVSRSVVCDICCGRQRNFKNYVVFRYKRDDFNRYPVESIQTKKKVDVYDSSTLEYINTFESLSECATELNVKKTNISSVCKGIYVQNKGYIFRFHGDPIDKYSTRIIKTHEKPVNQYNKDLYFINTYRSAIEASKNTGICRSCITSCCTGKLKTSGGFKWYYASDPSQPDQTKIIS